jgi:hypothetical protein
LSVLVLQDGIGQVAGMRVLDSVEHKDLTLVDHAVVIQEHSGSFLATYTFHIALEGIHKTPVRVMMSPWSPLILTVPTPDALTDSSSP